MLPLGTCSSEFDAYPGVRVRDFGTQTTATQPSCLRCGHKWESQNERPLRCAKCKTPYWDTPKPERE